MAHYLIGDLQGCYAEFRAVLEQAQFDPHQDHLWLCGDLVARGPDSLACLRYVKSLGDSATTVLGNHDLHLLATAIGVKKVKDKDKTRPILKADDRDELLKWLRQQPLLAEHPEFVMTHAGIPPVWDLATARQNAQAVEAVLRSKRYKWLLENMYSDGPALWHEADTELEQLRFTINAFTRMRFIGRDGALDAKCKLGPAEITPADGLVPWFNYPVRQPMDKAIVFGHWAALEGKFDGPEYGLDTGCVWGGGLTLLRWEDKQRFYQPTL
uniref:symmetrical bis(5'-nucleosyl)-tetraphosphatase n=1 Tax=Thaumasiovibrio occultus TaxID=1891184 RepID=UPI000B34EBA8|nr:symmetrical bis(5'-nucleosyl)-tetraphosphatase [Thaumasiovibrio occultus]